MIFKEKLKQLRKAAGMSQEDLAGKLNVSRQAVSRWETGETLPDADMLVQLSNLFEVSIDSLLKSEDDIIKKSNETANNIDDKEGLVYKITGICVTGASSIALLILGVLSSIFPVYRGRDINGGADTLYKANLFTFLAEHNLEWLFAVIIIALLIGILLISNKKIRASKRYVCFIERMNRVKKLLSIVLVLAISANAFLAYAYVDDVATVESDEAQTVEIDYGATKVITDPDEIKAIAEEQGFENPEKIVKLVYCYFEKDDYEDSAINNRTSKNSRYLGTDYYVKEDTITTKEEKGELLRSSVFSPPGGSMTIKEKVAVKLVSIDVEIDLDIISASLGFDVEKSYEVSETQNVSVPTGKTCTVQAHVNNLVKSFEIWEEDIWKDNLADRASVKKPIGVIFSVTVNN